MRAAVLSFFLDKSATMRSRSDTSTVPARSFLPEFNTRWTRCALGG
jgi:hypothetical protein